MKKEILQNFGKQNNDIAYIFGYQNIGDFCLQKSKNNKKIIEDAKVYFHIYGIESLEDLNKNNKKIIVVIPALTGTSKIFDSKASQGNGWANTYGLPGNVLDPNKNIVVGLDYFGSGFNNDSKKHTLDFYPVPPNKQVEAWKKALKKLGIQKINILFGGSNGGGHIHHWILNKDKSFSPEILIPIAGPIAPVKQARDFFKIQYDFLEKKDVSLELSQNLKNLKGNSSLFDFLVGETIKEIKENYNSKNDLKTMKIVRQIGFLRFVGPTFFDRFFNDKNGKELNINNAKKNLLNYFENEGKKFEKRFGKSYLKILLKGIYKARRLSTKEYLKKLDKNINLIVVGLQDDTLFEISTMKKYFQKLKNLRQQRFDNGKNIFILIENKNDSKKAGHDYFLWDSGAQQISDEILKNLKKINYEI